MLTSGKLMQHDASCFMQGLNMHPALSVPLCFNNFWFCSEVMLCDVGLNKLTLLQILDSTAQPFKYACLAFA